MRLSERRRRERIATLVAFAVALVAYASGLVEARRDYTDERRTVGSAQRLGSDATRLQNAESDVPSGSLLLGVRLRRRSSGTFALPRVPALRHARFANVLIAADAFSSPKTPPDVELVSQRTRTKLALDARLSEIAMPPARTNGYRLPIAVPRSCATARCTIVLRLGQGRWRVWRVALTAENAPNAPSSAP